MKNYIDILTVVSLNETTAQCKSIDPEADLIEVENKNYKLGDLLAVQQLDLPKHHNWKIIKKVSKSKKVLEQIEKSEIRTLKQISWITGRSVWFNGEDEVSYEGEDWKEGDLIYDVWNAKTGQAWLIKKSRKTRLDK